MSYPSISRIKRQRGLNTEQYRTVQIWSERPTTHPSESDQQNFGLDLRWLDGAGLTPMAFRILVYYSHYAVGTGVASRVRVRDVIADCRMTTKEITAVEKELVKRGFLEPREAWIGPRQGRVIGRVRKALGVAEVRFLGRADGYRLAV